jgi:hypothetical protein
MAENLELLGEPSDKQIARFFIYMRAMVESSTRSLGKAKTAAALRRDILAAARKFVDNTPDGMAFSNNLNDAYTTILNAKPHWWTEMADVADAFNATKVKIEDFICFLDVQNTKDARAAVTLPSLPLKSVFDQWRNSSATLPTAEKIMTTLIPDTPGPFSGAAALIETLRSCVGDIAACEMLRKEGFEEDNSLGFALAKLKKFEAVLRGNGKEAGDTELHVAVEEYNVTVAKIRSEFLEGVRTQCCLEGKSASKGPGKKGKKETAALFLARMNRRIQLSTLKAAERAMASLPAQLCQFASAVTATVDKEVPAGGGGGGAGGGGGGGGGAKAAEINVKEVKIRALAAALDTLQQKFIKDRKEQMTAKQIFYVSSFVATAIVGHGAFDDDEATDVLVKEPLTEAIVAAQPKEGDTQLEYMEYLHTLHIAGYLMSKLRRLLVKTKLIIVANDDIGDGGTAGAPNIPPSGKAAPIKVDPTVAAEVISDSGSDEEDEEEQEDEDDDEEEDYDEDEDDEDEDDTNIDESSGEEGLESDE